MKLKEQKDLDVLWYIFYVIANIVTLLSVWFIRNLITYSIKCAFEDCKCKK